MFVIPCFFLLMPFSSAYKILFLPRDGSHSRFVETKFVIDNIITLFFRAMSHYAQQLVLRGHSVKFWMFKSAYFYPAANITYTLESVDLPLKMKNSPFLQFHNFLTEIHPSLRPADLVLLLNESLYSCGRYLTRKKYY